MSLTLFVFDTFVDVVTKPEGKPSGTLSTMMGGPRWWRWCHYLSSSKQLRAPYFLASCKQPPIGILQTIHIMMTADCSLRAVHPLKQPGASNFSRRPGFLRFGPRYNEDFIQVNRWDKNGEIHDLSLYYRVYNPSLMHSLESPPLIVLHGGP